MSEPSDPPRRTQDANSARVEKVLAELAGYEHPLFTFGARPSGEAVDVVIEFRGSEPAVHTYVYTLQPRDIDHAQFRWSFQRQLYDCLHDYVVEMFTRNPQFHG